MRKRTRDEYEQAIRNVQFHIQEHLDEKISMDDLARAAGFSMFHFHRIFSAMVGENLGEHLLRLRMERAAFELVYSSRSIPDIAFSAGYENHESFTRAYRKRFGQTPSGYRKEARCDRGIGSSPALRAVIQRQGGKPMKVKVEQFQPMTVVSVRYTGPYAGCGVAWEKLCSSPRNSAGIGPKTLFIGISYDDPDIAEPGKIRYDACMTVTEGFEPEACFEKQTIKGGKYAVLRHTGPHDGLLACYRWFYGEWLPGSGCEPASAPVFEIYRNFPGETPPEKLITDICIPLEE